jgi:hypothetical protein
MPERSKLEAMHKARIILWSMDTITESGAIATDQVPCRAFECSKAGFLASGKKHPFQALLSGFKRTLVHVLGKRHSRGGAPRRRLPRTWLDEVTGRGSDNGFRIPRQFRVFQTWLTVSWKTSVHYRLAFQQFLTGRLLYILITKNHFLPLGRSED